MNIVASSSWYTMSASRQEEEAILDMQDDIVEAPAISE
jgi:hypothetical protein